MRNDDLAASGCWDSPAALTIQAEKEVDDEQ
jgi:hypothetical protein